VRGWDWLWVIVLINLSMAGAKVGDAMYDHFFVKHDPVCWAELHHDGKIATVAIGNGCHKYVMFYLPEEIKP
jgi:hypothetical protein